jgi:CheY-like chemotaxis protein/PAS domain-containing protein
MSAERPRLLVPAGTLAASERQVDTLRSAFDVVEVESADEAARMAADGGGGLVLLPAAAGTPGLTVDGDGLPAVGLRSILEDIGEGVGVVDASGRLTWANTRLREYGDTTRQRFAGTCVHAMEQFNQAGGATMPVSGRPGRRFSFPVGESYFETLVSIAAIDEERDHEVTAVVGVLWEVTESRRLQAKIDAIDGAGSELMRIESAAITTLNMAERLVLLEEKIIRSVRELLHFDKFEIRLIDQETNQLELVFNQGLTPLKIGEVLYAEKEDNGISGMVAATGEPYICNDITKDPSYREGLDDAASSLTVPLRLHDQVIGVFNVESNTKNAFTVNDQRFAQIFGRYIAMAMHILDLLVVERYTTNEQVAQNVLHELSEPISEITSRTAALRAGVTDPEMREGLDRILESAGGILRRLEACTAGPKTILGAEQALHREETDPRMVGKRVILADNEPDTRGAISALLSQRGCQVTVCAGGAETIDLIRASCRENRAFDLVISDIKMPDRNGYEVFRTAKECCADTPVILITGFGYDPHHSIVRASQEGLHSFLFKPLKAEQLLDAVAKAFA